MHEKGEMTTIQRKEISSDIWKVLWINSEVEYRLWSAEKGARYKEYEWRVSHCKMLCSGLSLTKSKGFRNVASVRLQQSEEDENMIYDWMFQSGKDQTGEPADRHTERVSDNVTDVDAIDSQPSLNNVNDLDNNLAMIWIGLYKTHVWW